MMTPGPVLFAAMAILMAPPAPAGPPAPVAYDVPDDAGPQQVQVLERVIAPGGESGWHTHPGVEIGVLISGATELHMRDGTVRKLAVGESFLIPRGTVHNGTNPGETPARLILTYVIDRGQLVRSAAPPPPEK